jgi:uncharacterized membrane protein (UPF0127 family)
MLFVDTKGRVTKIIAHAQPLSLATLSSDGAVRAVLELKGGTASQLGIKVGDLMQWKTPGAR